jgi:predicted dehydrogenase
MFMDAHNILLIGYGNMGKNHFRVLNENTAVKIAGVVDPFINKSEWKNASIPVYSELKEVPTESYDAAIIASSTETHFQLAQSRPHVT